jgi:hypothetical protein
LSEGLNPFVQPSSFPILFGSQWGARGLDGLIAALDTKALCAEYVALRANAPRRSSVGKAYFVGHSGVPSASGSSNRLEEHYELALINLRRRWPRADGGWFCLLDYQVPLKARQSDAGVGKIDLLGITDKGRLIILELKVVSQAGGRSDAPPSALLEGLRYSAMVQADFDALSREVESKYGTKLSDEAPIVMVIAPQTYWRAWLELKAAGEWGVAFDALAAAISTDTGVVIECVALEDVDVEYGLNGAAPRLSKVPSMSVVQPGGKPAIGVALTASQQRPQSSSAYKRKVHATLWEWAEANHKGQIDGDRREDRSPVLKPEFSELNVLVVDGHPDSARARDLIGMKQRHRHFGSLRSSQAVAQSVFGALSVLGRLDLLESIRAECGRSAFATDLRGCSLSLEYDVDYLGEPRATSIDVLLSGETVRVAIECKFMEEEYGTCSRPRLEPGDPSYAAQRCDGTYKAQAGRIDRCPLTTIGVRYWDFLPGLFNWQAGQDLSPCQFGDVYQLGRNALAATVSRDGKINPAQGHALVVYDANNPAFQFGGAADRQWETALAACLVPGLLRRVSWQRLLSSIGADPDMARFARSVQGKCGFQ